MQQLIEFGIAAGKLTISAVCIIILLGVAYLVFFVVMEAAWTARQENRRKYEQEDKKE